MGLLTAGAQTPSRCMATRWLPSGQGCRPRPPTPPLRSPLLAQPWGLSDPLTWCSSGRASPWSSALSLAQLIRKTGGRVMADTASLAAPLASPGPYTTTANAPTATASGFSRASLENWSERKPGMSLGDLHPRRCRLRATARPGVRSA